LSRPKPIRVAVPIEEEEGGWMLVFRMGTSGGVVNTVLNLGVP
jgi:hypothetical protein